MTVQKMTAKNNTQIANKKIKNDSEIFADDSISASIMNAAVAEKFNKALFPEVGILDLANALNEKIVKVQAGDMSSIEAMLIGQAQALQTMFVTLGCMAASKTSLPQYTAFMGMALKAQSQSRATIQALTELKYPKQATFVKQANISNGHQQVNNATNTHAPARVKEIKNQPNKLLEVNNGSKAMDIRATQTTIPKDQAMATMEAQHRS